MDISEEGEVELDLKETLKEEEVDETEPETLEEGELENVTEVESGNAEAEATANANAESDLALLASLGVNLVDREEFEAEFINNLQQQFDQANFSPNSVNEGTKTPETPVKEEEPPSVTEVTDDSKEEGFENQDDSKSTRQDVPSRPSSILFQLLDKSSQSKSQARVPRTSQSKIDKHRPLEGQAKSTPDKKMDSFLDLSKYLQNQREMKKKFQKQKAKVNAKGENGESSSSESKSKPSTSKITKSKKRKKHTLDVNILFPKKKTKKPKLGTYESQELRDQRRTPGKSLAETTSMYLNESDDSDYIPSDLDSSDDDRDKAVNTRDKLRQRSAKRRFLGSDSDDSYESEPCQSGTARRRKEADDGNSTFYKKRIEEWKQYETRITADFHAVDGDFKIPEYLWESLYSYQRTGVKWLWELHQQRTGGILGDEMGLGKTIQVIAFLSGLVCSNLLGRFTEYRGLGPSLIICPATVMHQWVKEFHVWWPPLRVAILHESGSYGGSKKELIRTVQNSKGIMITSYAGVVNNQNEILKHQWHYVIVDEGHKMRNPDAQVTLTLKQIKTPHRLILSGSPLQNNLKELWSLFDFIHPGKLGTLPTFMEQFAVPITQGGYSNASEIQVATAFKCATMLRNLISPYLLRRMKADVNKHLNLPSKSEQVLFCKLTPAQKELYLDYISSKEINCIVKGDANVFVGLINLRKICNHPHLFDGGPKVFKQRDESRIPKNKVQFSGEAPSSLAATSSTDGDTVFGHWTKSGKMIVIKTLLKLWREQKHKVLLFTQSRQMLCILESFVRKEKYSYLRLDGGTSIAARQPLIAKFNQDPNIFVFLLTTRVGGLGVNLTGANRVILFDPDWNPSTDLQARERAWRIGQDRQVTIYRLITAGTIEEKIYHRQIFKQFLTNRVLKNPKQRRFFKSNDMLELFTYNEGTKGTESEAIFAGTGSRIKVKKPTERASGKLKRIPHLVKQRPVTEAANEESGSTSTEDQNKNQDEYVLSKLFKKSGVSAALRHDKIVDTGDPDYLLVEQEAEQVAKDAVRALKASRRQCWSAESGRVTWTGAHGEVNTEAAPVAKSKPLFGPKKKARKPVVAPPNEEQETGSFFSRPQLASTSSQSQNLTSADLIAMIRATNPDPTPTPAGDAEDEVDEDNLESLPVTVSDDNIQLLRDIREFIAFRAMIDGQATTEELIAEFGNKLPPRKSPIFKQMLEQLCTHRQVEGKRLWRLKPEFR